MSISKKNIDMIDNSELYDNPDHPNHDDIISATKAVIEDAKKVDTAIRK